MDSSKSKSILKTFTPPLVPEGDGATVCRVIGNKHFADLDPFLMLDYASVKLPTAFPDHPHRGFEAVSYILKGSMYHEDSKGNKGTIRAGDCQWMTTGKGLVHAEVPASREELSVGFQLWINLAAKDKFCDPAYQEIKKDNIPIASKDGTTVKVIAGESLGVSGPINARIPAIYLDVDMEKNSKLSQIVPEGWNSFCFVYEGQAVFGKEKVKLTENSCVVFKNDGNEIVEVETNESPAKFLFLAGKPIKENIERYGPFVLNTKKELMQAFEDYNEGKNGFEGIHEWESELKKLYLK